MREVSVAATSDPASAGAPPGLAPAAARLLDRLNCPECTPQAAPLAQASGMLVCTVCAARYPVQHGVPILLARASRLALGRELGSETGRAMAAEYAAAGARAMRHGRLLRSLKPPPLMLDLDPGLNRPELRALWETAGRPAEVLNVGGGPTRYRPHETTLNIDVFPNVDVVGDAHRMPFRAGAFDSLFSVAVLEHVHSPETIVAEMIRVLRPGGLLYAEVPFIFFFHGYPNDFRRYTLGGMRHLFAALRDARFGITHGPMSAMLQSANTLLQLVVPERWPLLLKLVRGLFGWSAFPLKYLDRRLIARPDAHILAGGFWVLGRTPGGNAA